ncbi:helix-turn-helix domain-containing protein [Microbispora sp. NBC_01189]|uniref:helix-turn-helix domain-containing protein n=1 Tax=Microbispora sp. NBC_01189 TaxID=2903583 RepID=UPI002E11C356|nr:helix-turn-helix domain-containing protein [Microbispora sp. NBC_01189]
MAVNERLRTALLNMGMTGRQLAELIGVDPKTVERWVNIGRTPHPAIAQRAALALREDLAYLWPETEQGRRRRQGTTDLVIAYPTRATAPFDLWRTMFEQAEQEIGILVYAAIFIHESWPDFSELLATKAQAGCRIRIMLGDADSPIIRSRGQEEKYGHGIEARCRVALMHYRPLMKRAGIDVRVHGTTLYNSLYRGDDQMIVNAHVFGMNAYGAPVYHLRRTGEGGLYDVYAAGFEAVWEQSRRPGE